MATLDVRKGAYRPIFYYNNTTFDLSVTFTDDDDAAVDLSGKTLTFTIKRTAQHSTAILTLTTADAISVSGASNNIVTFSGVYGFSERSYVYDLKNSTDSDVLMYGAFTVTKNVT
jgi:hypothetical protein